MKKRILAAIPIILIVALALIVQSFVLIALSVTLAIFTQVEMMRAMGKTVKWVSILFALTCGVIFVWSVVGIKPTSMDGQYNSLTMLLPSLYMIVFVVFIFLAFIACVFSQKKDFKDLQNTIFTLCYPQLFFVFFYSTIAIYLQNYIITLVMLLFVFALPMLSDTLAYFIGKTFGKTKLCPKISPNKTVAGSVAGVVGGLLCAFLIWIVFARDYNLASVLILGGVLAIVSQLGDLSASYIKRAVNIKDFGNLIPGHGGILDRLDSILFCMPIVYITFTFIGLY